MPVGEYSFGIILDMKAFELDELIESERTEGYAFTRVLPPCPCKILTPSVHAKSALEPKAAYRTGEVASVDKDGPSLNLST